MISRSVGIGKFRFLVTFYYIYEIVVMARNVITPCASLSLDTANKKGGNCKVTCCTRARHSSPASCSSLLSFPHIFLVFFFFGCFVSILWRGSRGPYALPVTPYIFVVKQNYEIFFFIFSSTVTVSTENSHIFHKFTSE